MRAGCWAHMRWKWREAMPKGATLTSSKDAAGMDYCTKLFEARRRNYRPIVEESYALYHPAGKLKEAVSYAQNPQSSG